MSLVSGFGIQKKNWDPKRVDSHIIKHILSKEVNDEKASFIIHLFDFECFNIGCARQEPVEGDMENDTCKEHSEVEHAFEKQGGVRGEDLELFTNDIVANILLDFLGLQSKKVMMIFKGADMVEYDYLLRICE